MLNKPFQAGILVGAEKLRWDQSQKNSTAQSLSIDYHLSFGQKWRSIIYPIFCEEGLLSVTDLTKNIEHCNTLNSDFYRLRSLQMKHFAYRKLFNPFKWIECMLTLLLKMPVWAIQHVGRAPENKIKKIIFGLRLICAFLIGRPLDLITGVALGAARRILAPVRYIIRPTIALARHSPSTFAILLITTLSLIAMMGLAIFTGGTSLAIGSLISTLAGKVGLLIAAAATTWVLALKCTQTITEGADLIKQIALPDHKKDLAESFISGSTHKIAALFQAIDIKHTELLEPSKQNKRYKLALFFGVESFCYPRETPVQDACVSQLKFINKEIISNDFFATMVDAKPFLTKISNLASKDLHDLLKNFDMTQKNPLGNTLLMAALWAGKEELALTLIRTYKDKAGIDIQNQIGLSPLMAATFKNQAEVVAALINVGVNQDLEAARILAVVKGYKPLLKILDSEMKEEKNSPSNRNGHGT